MMYFGLGSHPGFSLPFSGSAEFEDYFLRFPEGAKPQRIWYDADCFRNGKLTPFPLENGRDLPLRHTMFDDDAITLENTGGAVTLMTDKDSKKITVSYPDCPYVSFWHRVGTDAPYVCIEPWVTLPGKDETPTVFENQPDLIRLAPGKVYENGYTVTVGN